MPKQPEHAPHHLKKLKREDFMAWLERRGASLRDLTNPYEVVRYRMWCHEDQKRPSTHVIYKRGNDSLTYQGLSRDHYEAFLADKERGL